MTIPFYIRSRNDNFSYPFPTREQAQVELTRLEKMFPWNKGTWDIVEGIVTHKSEQAELRRRIQERARILEEEIRAAMRQA
jgi:hypothetical protein